MWRYLDSYLTNFSFVVIHIFSFKFIGNRDGNTDGWDENKCKIRLEIWGKTCTAKTTRVGNCMAKSPWLRTKRNVPTPSYWAFAPIEPFKVTTMGKYINNLLIEGGGSASHQPPSLCFQNLLVILNHIQTLPLNQWYSTEPLLFSNQI